MNHSPGRHTFQLDCYLARCAADGQDPDPSYVELYTNIQKAHRAQDQDDTWKKHNMEHDLRSTKWICDKAKASPTYAQNLYAAMCNREFQRQEVWPILKNDCWSCSWRYAGGIVADMLESGDYIDWYCSGIGDGLGNGDLNGTKKYMSEGQVSDEIREDLALLGWQVLDDQELAE